jgi:uncharacterized RDD family membrane protein YckC
VSPSPPTKVLGRRYVAHLIDALVRVAAAVVPFVLLAERVDTNGFDPTIADRYERVDTFAVGADRAIRIDDRLFILERQELVIIAAIALGVVLLFDVLIQGRAGWTLGKALTGLRTVKGTGERPGVFRALLRTILLAIDAIPSYLFPLVGGLVIFASDNNRRFGDLVAGTYVVDRHAVGEDPRAEGEGDLDTTDWARSDDDPPLTTLSEGEALRVGTAAPPSGVSEPTPVAAAATATDEAKAPAYQPQWDPARKAYLQWDPRRETWLQFDDDAQEWRPIG